MNMKNLIKQEWPITWVLLLRKQHGWMHVDKGLIRNHSELWSVFERRSRNHVNKQGVEQVIPSRWEKDVNLSKCAGCEGIKGSINLVWSGDSRQGDTWNIRAQQIKESSFFTQYMGLAAKDMSDATSIEDFRRWLDKFLKDEVIGGNALHPNGNTLH